jgi:autotransporter-associated beta strand protein
MVISRQFSPPKTSRASGEDLGSLKMQTDLRRVGAVVLMTLAFAFGSQAKAQTAISWSSTSASSWSTTGSWTGGVLPANDLTTNYASFNNATGVSVTIGNQNVAGIDFGSSAGAYTLTRSSSGGATVFTVGAYGIRTSSSSNQTISGSKQILALGANSSFLVNGSGSLDLSPANGIDIAAIDIAANTLTLGGSGSGQGTISTAISGTGGVTKTDSGTWTLSGANTYTGTTTVSGGTLQFAAAQTFSGGLNLTAGTLALNGNSVSFGALTVTGNSVIDFGGASAASLTVASLNISAGVTLTLMNWAATDTFTVTANPAAVLSQVVFNNYPGTFASWSGGKITPVPEPSTYGVLFLMLSMGGYVWHRRCKRPNRNSCCC